MINAGCKKYTGANDRPIAPLNTVHAAYFNPGFLFPSIACVANRLPIVPTNDTPKYAHLFTANERKIQYIDIVFIKGAYSLVRIRLDQPVRWKT